MPLTSEQAFKIGFLQECAEEGLTLDETLHRVKQAIHMKRTNDVMEKDAWVWPALAGTATGLSWLAGKAIGAIPSTLSTLGTLGIALPVAAGGATGYIAAKMTRPDGKNMVEEAKTDEIKGEYERLADEARRRARLRRLQQATGRRVIALSPGD